MTKDADREAFNAVKEIEIEQKFALSPDENNTDQHIHDVLKSLGFQPAASPIRFTDTYLDVLVPNHPETTLDSTHDKLIGMFTVQHKYWLRYRELQLQTFDDQTQEYNTKGLWQLKRPPNSLKSSKPINDKDKTSAPTSSTSVYEELEGQDAIKAIQALLQNEINDLESIKQNLVSLPSHFQPHNAPILQKLPNDLQSKHLLPFASFETTRSTWKYANTNAIANDTPPTNETDSKKNDFSYRDIKVDIDGTDFGYMVGEVEIIVHSEDQIPSAQACIEDFIRTLSSTTIKNYKTKQISSTETPPRPAHGKLETYLIKTFPQLYEACMASGSM